MIDGAAADRIGHDIGAAILVEPLAPLEMVVARHRGQADRAEAIVDLPDDAVGAVVMPAVEAAGVVVDALRLLVIARDVDAIGIRAGDVAGKELRADLPGIGLTRRHQCGDRGERPGIRAIDSAVPGDGDAQPVIVGEEQRAAEESGTDLAVMIAAAAIGLRAVPLAHHLGCDPPGERIADERAADRRFDVEIIVPAEIDLRITIGGEARLARDEIDRARGGIAAVKRPLRAFEHLDPLLIEHLEGEHRRGRLIDAVDIDAGGLRGAFVVIVRAHPAEGDRGIAVLAERQMDREIGRVHRQIAHAGRAFLAQPIAVEGVDGDPDLVESLLAMLRRDDDVAALDGAGFGLGGCRVRRRGDGGGRADQQQRGRLEKQSMDVRNHTPPPNIIGQRLMNDRLTSQPDKYLSSKVRPCCRRLTSQP